MYANNISFLVKEYLIFVYPISAVVITQGKYIYIFIYIINLNKELLYIVYKYDQWESITKSFEVLSLVLLSGALIPLGLRSRLCLCHAMRTEII